jgi:hypothetical protein
MKWPDTGYLLERFTRSLPHFPATSRLLSSPHNREVHCPHCRPRRCSLPGCCCRPPSAAGRLEPYCDVPARGHCLVQRPSTQPLSPSTTNKSYSHSHFGRTTLLGTRPMGPNRSATSSASRSSPPLVHVPLSCLDRAARTDAAAVILADSFDPRTGHVEDTVFWVYAGNYSLILYGDSGNLLQILGGPFT